MKDGYSLIFSVSCKKFISSTTSINNVYQKERKPYNTIILIVEKLLNQNGSKLNIELIDKFERYGEDQTYGTLKNRLFLDVKRNYFTFNSHSKRNFNSSKQSRDPRCKLCKTTSIFILGLRLIVSILNLKKN